MSFTKKSLILALTIALVVMGAAAALAAPPKLKAGSEEGSVDLAVFEDIAKNKVNTVMIIDVRDKVEYDAGAIKGSVNMPMDSLEGKLGTLPKDKPIIFVCGTGARSGEAYYMVADNKPDMVKNVYYVDGEITFNKDGSFKASPPK